MTLGTHADPDLHHARVAAERALRDRWEAAGCPPDLAAGIAEVDAEVATDAAWCDLKRAHRPPMEDGR